MIGGDAVDEVELLEVVGHVGEEGGLETTGDEVGEEAGGEKGPEGEEGGIGGGSGGGEVREDGRDELLWGKEHRFEVLGRIHVDSRGACSCGSRGSCGSVGVRGGLAFLSVEREDGVGVAAEEEVFGAE